MVREVSKEELNSLHCTTEQHVGHRWLHQYLAPCICWCCASLPASRSVGSGLRSRKPCGWTEPSTGRSNRRVSGGSW
jgi:hypothetical protein